MKRKTGVSWKDFQAMPIQPAYQTRFVKSTDTGELINLYHLARTALAKPGPVPTAYDRMLWASGAFAKAHPYVTSTGAYKDLCGLLDR